MSAYDPSGQKWRIANREKASVFTMHTARCRRRRRWENVKRTRRRICRVVGQRLRVAGVLAIDTGASYLVEIEAGDDRPHRRQTPDGIVVVVRCRFILRNTLSHRVLLESHSDWHVRFGFIPTRIWSELAITGVVRGRNRGYRGCARRSQPRPMGAVVARCSTSFVRLAPPCLTGHPRRCKLPLPFGDPHACCGVVSNGCCDVPTLIAPRRRGNPIAKLFAAAR